MRKILIGLLLAGAALAPTAAGAQQGDRSEWRASRAERQEARQQRQESRQEQRAARIEARQQRVQSAPAQAQIAQRGERRRGGDGSRGGRRGDNDGGRAGPTASGYQRGWQGPPGTENSAIARRYNRRAQENAIRYGTREQRRDAIRDARRDWREDRREGRRDWREARRDLRRDWNRSWRSDRRYAWQDWRYRNRDLYRLGRYYSPYPGWGYRRFSIGLVLDPLFFGQRYWISDPFEYRLPPALPGTQWVRYYNDVLLVDIYSGEVLDVIHDFFW